MPELRDILSKHFRVYDEHDSLPYGLRFRRRRHTGRAMLARVMRDLGFHVGAEIGIQYGLSAKLWCETIPGLKLFCIDPYTVYRMRRSQQKQDAVYEEARARLAPFNVTWLREKSCDAVDKFKDGSLDFLDVDGDHGFDVAVMDIIKYAPKVRRGGLILVHDYLSFYGGGVVQAVDGYTQAHRINRWYVTADVTPTAFWERGAEQA